MRVLRTLVLGVVPTLVVVALFLTIPPKLNLVAVLGAPALFGAWAMLTGPKSGAGRAIFLVSLVSLGLVHFACVCALLSNPGEWTALIVIASPLMLVVQGMCAGLGVGFARLARSRIRARAYASLRRAVLARRQLRFVGPFR